MQHAEAAALPDITWCYIEEKDTYAVLHFETPSEYMGLIDSYELRTGDADWFTVTDGAGGSVMLPKGGMTYLRYCRDSAYSTEWSTYVQFGDAYILSDTVSGVSAAYRDSAQFPNSAYLSADRITSGNVFETVKQAVQTSRHFELYDIYFLYANGYIFNPGDAATIRIPLGDKLKRNHCKVYYVDEVGKRLLILPESYDRSHVAFTSRGGGLYFVVDEWNGTDEIPAIQVPAMGSRFDFYGKKLMMGDTDNNYTVTANDARTVLRASVGLDTLQPWQTECGDIDWDGTVSASDARTVLRYSAGLV